MRQLFTLLIVLVFPHISVAQKQTKLFQAEGFRIYWDTTISLSDSSVIKNKERIIVFKETGHYILFTSYNIFLNNLNAFIEKHNVAWDKDLLTELLRHREQVVDASTIGSTTLCSSRIRFRLADLLQKKNCLFYNKDTKQLEKKVKIKWYRYGRNCITKGRLFYVNATQILITEDGVT